MNECKKHDGVSPIIFTKGKDAMEKDAQFRYLWDFLVPISGRAQTAQGEVIRIAGRIDHEIMNNGGLNWDKNYTKMLETFFEYMSLGNPLENNAETAKRISSALIECARKRICDEHMCAELCECAVDWVQQNPNIMALLKADYKI